MIRKQPWIVRACCSHYERPSQPAVVKTLVGGIVATMIGTAHGEDGPLSACGKSWVRSRAGRLTGNRRGRARFRKQEIMVTAAAVTQPNPMISRLVMGRRSLYTLCVRAVP